MKLFEMMVNHKINQIRPDELLSLAKQHQISLTQKQASDITALLAGRNINIFDIRQRQNVLGQITQVAGANTARAIETLFNNLTANM
ncbi:DUF2624 family protein [Peribacillus sp. NPDC097264]|uniref:DUF2624 family protein n=1 Tax=unclassified Peribacillus TaxID=2675266 RepID=UPI00382F755A